MFYQTSLPEGVGPGAAGHETTGRLREVKKSFWMFRNYPMVWCNGLWVKFEVIFGVLSRKGTGFLGVQYLMGMPRHLMCSKVYHRDVAHTFSVYQWRSGTGRAWCGTICRSLVVIQCPFVN